MAAITIDVLCSVMNLEIARGDDLPIDQAQQEAKGGTGKQSRPRALIADRQ